MAPKTVQKCFSSTKPDGKRGPKRCRDVSRVETTNQQLFSLLAARTVSADVSEEFCKATMNYVITCLSSVSRWHVTLSTLWRVVKDMGLHCKSSTWFPPCGSRKSTVQFRLRCQWRLKELKLNENNQIETDVACNATGNQVWVSRQAPSRLTIRWYPLLDAKISEHSTLWASLSYKNPEGRLSFGKDTKG